MCLLGVWCGVFLCVCVCVRGVVYVCMRGCMYTQCTSPNHLCTMFNLLYLLRKTCFNFQVSQDSNTEKVKINLLTQIIL